MRTLDQWTYRLGEIKVTDTQNNLQYDLVIGHEARNKDNPGKSLYIRIYNDYDLVVGSWVDDIEKETSRVARDAIKEKRLSPEILKQCVNYARRMEAVKVFS